MGKVGKARDPKISWFVWQGERCAPLAQISPTYRLRYSHEHGYRFDKQELLWDVPRGRNAGRTSSPALTISWCWLVLWWRGAIDRGRHAPRFGRWRRCDGLCPPFCTSWGRLLDRHNCVEKRRDGPKAFIPSPGHVIRRSVKRAKSRKRAKREPLSEVVRLIFFMSPRLSWF